MPHVAKMRRSFRCDKESLARVEPQPEQRPDAKLKTTVYYFWHWLRQNGAALDFSFGFFNSSHGSTAIARQTEINSVNLGSNPRPPAS
jgi:hypothetical protein